MTTIEAIFDGQAIRPQTPLAIAPNTRLRVTIETIDAAPVTAPSFLRVARTLDLDAPPDFATTIDTVLYGATPDATR